MTKQPKYETLTELGALDLIHIAVSTILEDVRNGRVVEGIPKLTEDELDTVSFESSFFEHRIVFYPEDERNIVIHMKSKEY